MDQSPPPQPPPAGPADDAAPLETELSGDLPCIVCRYNLRGLSILSICPECGTRVRATILARVDPHAAELRPIPHPRLTAAAIVLWSFGALAAGLVCWMPQIAAVVAAARSQPAPLVDVRLWLAAALALSWAGALGLIAPQAQVARRNMLLAIVACAAYLPLAWALWNIAAFTAAGEIGVMGQWTPHHERTLWRLLAGLMVAAIALGLRPNARLLVARSLVLRTGRVDRQALLAMAAAAAVWSLGDLLFLLFDSATGFIAQVGRIVAAVLVVTGSILVTLGLAGAATDSARIARSILRPAPSLDRLLRPAGPGSSPERKAR